MLRKLCWIRAHYTNSPYSEHEVNRNIKMPHPPKKKNLQVHDNYTRIIKGLKTGLGGASIEVNIRHPSLHSNSALLQSIPNNCGLGGTEFCPFALNIGDSPPSYSPACKWKHMLQQVNGTCVRVCH